jgi:GTP-binding protein EngB required for normal cell division
VPDTHAVKDWITQFILNSRLHRVLLLIDARHGLKQADVDFLGDLQSADQPLPPLQVVLTKCDLVGQTDLARRVVQVRQQISDCMRRETSQLPILFVSATQAGGVLELQKELAALVVPHKKELPQQQQQTRPQGREGGRR